MGVFKTQEKLAFSNEMKEVKVGVGGSRSITALNDHRT